MVSPGKSRTDDSEAIEKRLMDEYFKLPDIVDLPETVRATKSGIRRASAFLRGRLQTRPAEDRIRLELEPVIEAFIQVWTDHVHELEEEKKELHEDWDKESKSELHRLRKQLDDMATAAEDDLRTSQRILGSASSAVHGEEDQWTGKRTPPSLENRQESQVEQESPIRRLVHQNRTYRTEAFLHEDSDAVVRSALDTVPMFNAYERRMTAGVWFERFWQETRHLTSHSRVVVFRARTTGRWAVNFLKREDVRDCMDKDNWNGVRKLLLEKYGVEDDRHAWREARAHCDPRKSTIFEALEYFDDLLSGTSMQEEERARIIVEWLDNAYGREDLLMQKHQGKWRPWPSVDALRRHLLEQVRIDDGKNGDKKKSGPRDRFRDKTPTEGYSVKRLWTGPVGEADARDEHEIDRNWAEHEVYQRHRQDQEWLNDNLELVRQIRDEHLTDSKEQQYWADRQVLLSMGADLNCSAEVAVRRVETAKTELKCRKCGKPGHTQRNCWAGKTCDLCLGENHIKAHCYRKCDVCEGKAHLKEECVPWFRSRIDHYEKKIKALVEHREEVQSAEKLASKDNDQEQALVKRLQSVHDEQVREIQVKWSSNPQGRRSKEAGVRGVRVRELESDDPKYRSVRNIGCEEVTPRNVTSKVGSEDNDDQDPSPTDAAVIRWVSMSELKPYPHLPKYEAELIQIEVLDRVVIACIDGGSTLNILRQDLFLELDRDHEMPLWQPPTVMVSAFGQRTPAKAVVELEISIDVFKKKLPFYITSQASDPMILGMDFTLGCVSATKTSVRGEPRLEIPVTECETISVPTRVSYRMTTEKVRTPLGCTFELAPGESRSMEVLSPMPRESGIPPERVEIARRRILSNGVEQISVMAPDDRKIYTCLTNDTEEWQQVAGGLWVATYVHPKPSKPGRVVEEVDEGNPAPTPQVLSTKETLRTAWSRRVATTLSGHNPTYDIDTDSPPMHKSLLVGELTQPETWPDWPQMTREEWESSKWKNPEWEVRLACAAGWDLTLPVLSQLRVPAIRREDYPSAPAGYEYLSMSELQEIGIRAWRSGTPSILDVWLVDKSDLGWAENAMDTLSRNVRDWHQAVTAASGKGDATNWSVFSWAVEVALAEGWLSKTWDSSRILEAMDLDASDSPKSEGGLNFLSADHKKKRERMFLASLKQDPNLLDKAKKDADRRQASWVDTAQDWYSFRVQRVLEDMNDAWDNWTEGRSGVLDAAELYTSPEAGIWEQLCPLPEPRETREEISPTELNWSRDLNLGEQLTPREKYYAEMLLWTHRRVFAQKSSVPSQTPYAECKVELKEGDAGKPSRRATPRMNPTDKDAAMASVAELAAHRLIIPWMIGEPPEVHQLVMVDKPDGTKRTCINYRPINKRVKTEWYGIPRVDDTVEWAAGEAAYLSVFDCASGFWIIPMEKDSRKFTVFVDPCGKLWQWKVMAMGMKNSGWIFQKMINRVLGLEADVDGIPSSTMGRRAYLDDVTVKGESFEGHLEELDAVLSMMYAWGISLRL